MRLAAALIVAPLVACLAGCLGTSPEQAAEDALPYDGREGSTHMPGYPCVVCHSEMTLAGTVYLRAGDAYGVQGANVRITDAAGQQLVLVTNRAGNFSLGGEDGGGRGGRGLAAPLRWPLRVEVEGAGVVRHMRSHLQREHSCATCHALTGESATSAGPIYLLREGG